MLCSWLSSGIDTMCCAGCLLAWTLGHQVQGQQPMVRSVEDVTPAPIVALAEEDSALAVETSASSLITALMHDVIDSMADIAMPAPEPAVPGALPMDIPVESPPPPVIMAAIPLNAAPLKAPEELEAA